MHRQNGKSTTIEIINSNSIKADTEQFFNKPRKITAEKLTNWLHFHGFNSVVLIVRNTNREKRA